MADPTKALASLTDAALTVVDQRGQAVPLVPIAGGGTGSITEITAPGEDPGIAVTDGTGPVVQLLNTGLLDLTAEVDSGLTVSGGQHPTIDLPGPIPVDRLEPGANGQILETTGGVVAWGVGINVGQILFGSGADGDLAPGFGAIVLTRDMNYG